MLLSAFTNHDSGTIMYRQRITKGKKEIEYVSQIIHHSIPHSFGSYAWAYLHRMLLFGHAPITRTCASRKHSGPDRGMLLNRQHIIFHKIFVGGFTCHTHGFLREAHDLVPFIQVLNLLFLVQHMYASSTFLPPAYLKNVLNEKTGIVYTFPEFNSPNNRFRISTHYLYYLLN